MVEAAKGCASSPKDRDQQQQLRVAAEQLRAATTAAASSALKKKIIKKLEVGTSYFLKFNMEMLRKRTKPRADSVV